MDYNKYSTSQEYELEFIPEDLGFFQKKSYIKEKVREKSENTLIFVQKDKILSVEVEDEMIGWLQYEKAVFFYNLFDLAKNYKYVFISENDSFFYGFIDGFPCVFKSDYDEAFKILNEYADGEFISVFCVGKSELEYISKKTLREILSLFQLDNEVVSDCVMESDLEYNCVCGSAEFTNLLFSYKSLNYEKNFNCLKKSCYYAGFGMFFLVLSFYVKNFC
ncbi:hypothetical protein [Alphaproteobacteria bacterium endosymbiont of Tiliacea citrago]|uniref:hypothetical protein n=1 Tax=Alphaproteobacteria bacterium endosymbiont of Tiliacea citrago TaxID=3077944 RepID=UPI00313AA4EC